MRIYKILSFTLLQLLAERAVSYFCGLFKFSNCKMMKKKRSIKDIGDDCDGLSGDENEPKEKVNKSTPHEVRDGV